jgi:V8-like Glu-specific endopeptidase
MAFLRLKGPQLNKLTSLLGAAFDGPSFDVLLLSLDRKMSDYVGPNDPLPTAILKTLQKANTQLWWRDLLREAVNTVPDPQLSAFLDECGFSPDFTASDQNGSTPLKGRQLELKITESGTTFDILVWRRRIAEIEGRVCRIEIPGLTARGTGFLVGPNLVLTNYHVVEAIHKTATPDQLVCRFDYKVLGNGVAVGPGKTYGLANGNPNEWLVDHSRYSALDFEDRPSTNVPNDELDYALLRTAGNPGNDLIAGEAQAPVPRGWIEAPTASHNFVQSPALNIVQHPDGRPMQIALDSNAVTGASSTRVQYRTTTLPGSSGSPCFSADWNWIALHHSGDPKYWKYGSKPEYNQGIPATAIMSLLQQRGKVTSSGGHWQWN